jgi:hypothetical protein
MNIRIPLIRSKVGRLNKSSTILARSDYHPLMELTEALIAGLISPFKTKQTTVSKRAVGAIILKYLKKVL